LRQNKEWNKKKGKISFGFTLILILVLIYLKISFTSEQNNIDSLWKQLVVGLVFLKFIGDTIKNLKNKQLYSFLSSLLFCLGIIIIFLLNLFHF
jgi:uncharacterized membrane protein YczE